MELEKLRAYQAKVFAAIVLLANSPKTLLPELPVHSVRRVKLSMLVQHNPALRVSIVLQSTKMSAMLLPVCFAVN